MVLALCSFDTPGNLVSAHHWHVCTTDLWCVTGALCVSGATSEADSTHRVPVILIQMSGARVTASQVTPLTHSPFVSNLLHWWRHLRTGHLWVTGCDAPQICSAYMSVVCRDQIPWSIKSAQNHLILRNWIGHSAWKGKMSYSAGGTFSKQRRFTLSSSYHCSVFVHSAQIRWWSNAAKAGPLG